MGRASRLTTNPDRARYQREQNFKRSYTPDPSVSNADLVKHAAMHEAGHVVAAVALGYGVRFSILNDKQRIGGYTEVTLDFLGCDFDSSEHAQAAATTPEVLHVRTMHVMSGMLAESIVNDDEDEIHKAGEIDERASVAYAMQALPHGNTKDWKDYIDERKNQMAAILTPLIPAIKRVANYLLTHRNENVPGETLTRLIHDSNG